MESDARLPAAVDGAPDEPLRVSARLVAEVVVAPARGALLGGAAVEAGILQLDGGLDEAGERPVVVGREIPVLAIGYRDGVRAPVERDPPLDAALCGPLHPAEAPGVLVAAGVGDGQPLVRVEGVIERYALAQSLGNALQAGHIRARFALRLRGLGVGWSGFGWRRLGLSALRVRKGELGCGDGGVRLHPLNLLAHAQGVFQAALGGEGGLQLLQRLDVLAGQRDDLPGRVCLHPPRRRPGDGLQAPHGCQGVGG